MLTLMTNRRKARELFISTLRKVFVRLWFVVQEVR